MNHIKPDYLKLNYETEIVKLEREFFGGMKAGKTLEELKPILLHLKQVKIYLTNLNTATQQCGNVSNSFS